MNQTRITIVMDHYTVFFRDNDKERGQFNSYKFILHAHNYISFKGSSINPLTPTIAPMFVIFSF